MKWMHTVGIVALSSASVWAAESVEREAKTTDSPSVSIELDSGFLQVETWGKDQVRLEGTLDERVEDWEFNARGDTVDIVIEDERRNRRWGDWDGDWSGRSDTELRLYVPAGTALSFEGMNASMVVSGIEGALEAETVNGDIEATDISGDLGLASVNGGIEILRSSGGLDVETVNGKVRIREATGEQIEISAVNGDVDIQSTATDVDIEAVSGDVEALLGDVKNMEISLVSGDLEAQLHLMDNGRVSASAVSGDLELALVEPVNIRVVAESMNGDLRNGITDDKAESERFHFGKNLEFTAGDASARIEVNTVSGDMYLKRAN